MRKFFLMFMFMMMLLLTACGGGNIRKVEIPDWGTSKIYTDDEIESALQTVKNYFAKEFDGCTLTKLYYPGDTYSDEFQEYAQKYNADEAIIFYSSFDVDSSGGDGSLNENSTYEDWKWILIRNKGENWEHADHGY